MRARKKKHGDERLAACADLIIHSPEEVPAGPITVEIGCGKGSFVCALARRHPDKQFVALEKISDVLLLACEKAKREELSNVKFLNCDAKELLTYFAPGQVERIYLNFSDPWPKAGYYKRRLTYKGFLELYKQVLAPDGAVFMKTDNLSLFEFSLEQFTACDFRLEHVTNDLWNSEFAADNIPTEYELRFHEMGIQINRLEAYIQ